MDCCQLVVSICIDPILSGHPTQRRKDRLNFTEFRYFAPCQGGPVCSLKSATRVKIRSESDSVAKGGGEERVCRVGLCAGVCGQINFNHCNAHDGDAGQSWGTLIGGGVVDIIANEWNE